MHSHASARTRRDRDRRKALSGAVSLSACCIRKVLRAVRWTALASAPRSNRAGTENEYNTDGGQLSFIETERERERERERETETERHTLEEKGEVAWCV
jgi:hypothetical protein